MNCCFDFFMLIFSGNDQLTSTRKEASAENSNLDTCAKAKKITEMIHAKADEMQIVLTLRK